MADTTKTPEWEQVTGGLRRYLQDQIDQTHRVPGIYLQVAGIQVDVHLIEVLGKPPMVGEITINLDIDKRIA